MMKKMVMKEWARTMGVPALDLVVEMMIPGAGGGIVDESLGLLWHYQSCSAGKASAPEASTISFARSAAAVSSAVVAGFVALSIESRLRRLRRGGKPPIAMVEGTRLRLHRRFQNREKNRCCC